LRGSSRCGLGVSSSKPLTTTLRDFPELGAAAMAEEGPLRPSFDEDVALSAYGPAADTITEQATRGAHQ
jgi:[NiFe] hydrogenase diaphorase moiety large subunit